MLLRHCVGAAILAAAPGCSHAEPLTPRVILVQPSGPQIPANLLRFSIRFATQVSAWKLSAVRAEPLQPLVVTFDGPIDGRDVGYLAIAGAS